MQGALTVGGEHSDFYSPRQYALTRSKYTLLRLLEAPWGPSPRWTVGLLREAGLKDTPGRYEPPGSQEHVVRDLQPAHSLLGIQTPELIWLPSLYFTSGCCTSATLLLERALKGSWLALLWYLLGCNPLFCECSRVHGEVLELSHRRDLFLCVPGISTVCVAM